MHRSLVLSLLLAILLVIIACQARAETQQGVSALSCGGGTRQDAYHKLDFTLGQPCVGRMSDGRTALIGFWSAYWMTIAVPVDSRVPAARFAMDAARPNPFVQTTIISFSVPRLSHVRLQLFDVRGREVRRLVETDVPPGLHRVNVQAGDLPAGVYFYRLMADGFVQSRKVVLIR